MRLRDTQKMLLIGIFWAAGAMAEETALQSCQIEAASAVKADMHKPPKGFSKASGSAAVKKGALPPSKKKSVAQNPALMQDEKQLGLGCAQH